MGYFNSVTMKELFVLRSLLLLMLVFFSSCIYKVKRLDEPKYPTPEQVGKAVENVIPQLTHPDKLGVAVEKMLLAGYVPIGTGSTGPFNPQVPSFLCGNNVCVCAEGENIPADKVEKWSCKGMGTACVAKGMIPQFPCRTLETSKLTVCYCRKPKK